MRISLRALQSCMGRWQRPIPNLVGSSKSLSTLLSHARRHGPVITSGIGSDSSMIAANDRKTTGTTTTSSSCGAIRTLTMKDEYGDMNDEGHTYVVDGDFLLENGQVLPQAQLRYQIYGLPLDTDNNNDNGRTQSNVLVVCHALTGNASLHGWWGELLGDGKAFDTCKYTIICCNILGSCYGSTSPISIPPNASRPYGMDFPDISVQDTVRLQLHLLRDKLQLDSVQCVIGGSFGGMQAMEFAVQGGSKYGSFRATDGSPFVKSVVPIACGASHTAWQIAISEVQRQAIYADPHWKSDPTQATAGLAVARQMGMISYRTPTGYQSKFHRTLQSDGSPSPLPLYGSRAPWQVKSYLEYQGQKFLGRFDPITYVKMTEQMDSHDIARGRAESVQEVLSQIEIPACVMGIDSDILYPLQEQEELAKYIPHAQLKVIHSPEGHDGFLLEQDQVQGHIVEFLDAQQL